MGGERRGELGVLREEYEALCAAGWPWRQALYVAWAKLPARGRWPATQAELAEVMGLKSDRAIRTWREKNPGIDLLVSQGTVERVNERTARVLSKVYEVAVGEDYKGHNDRKLWLEIEGVYRPKQDIVLGGTVNSDAMAEKAREAKELAEDWERERFGDPDDGRRAVDEDGGEIEEGSE